MNNIQVEKTDDIFVITRPDLYIFTFPVEEFVDTLECKYTATNMDVFLSWSYSVDSGTTWSRYYLDTIEHEKVIQFLRDTFSRSFTILLKCRLETILQTENTFEHSITEEPYVVHVHSVQVNNKPVTIQSQYVVNRNGITLPQHTQLWTPYANMDAAHRINEQTAIAINYMFGHWVYYFKTEPDEETKNVTLKSYTLHNVVAMKKIQISVPNNQFPDSRNIYSEWGIKLPDEFKVHILNDTFQRAFGPETYPHSHDYLYVPLTGIMYEVNSFWENKNFMYKPLWNEVIVVRYEDDKIVQKTEFEDDTFEYVELTEPGGLTIEEEQESQAADPNYLNIQLLEYFRTKLHKQTEIVNYELTCNRLKLWDNMYLFASVPVGTTGVAFDCKQTLLDNSSINFWVAFEKLTPTRDLFQCTNTNDEVILTCSVDKGLLKVTYRDAVLWSSTAFQTGIRYAISINLSIMYQYMELFVVGYDEEAGKLTSILSNPKCDIETTAYALQTMSLLGGKHLIGNMGLDKQTFDADTVCNRLTLVTPSSKTNVFFDKAALPITDSPLNGW